MRGVMSEPIEQPEHVKRILGLTPSQYKRITVSDRWPEDIRGEWDVIAQHPDKAAYICSRPGKLHELGLIPYPAAI